MNHNLYAQLLDLNKNRLDNTFLTTPEGAVLTYRQFDARTAAMATVLVDKIGLSAGDRVVVLVEKCVDAVVLYMSCLRCGVVFIPLNPGYSSEDIGFFLGDSDPELFVFAPDRSDKLRPTAEIAGVRNIVTLGADGTGSLVDATDLLLAEKVSAPVHASAGADIAVMLYTQGTQSRPKAVMLSHHNLAVNAAAMFEAWRFQPSDIVVHALFLFHMHGLFVALHPAMANGSEVILLSEFDVDEVRRCLRRATIFMGVPVHYQQLLNVEDFGDEDCTSVRLFLSGSAPLPEDVFTTFASRTNNKIVERYGVTECGVIATNDLDEPPEAGSVGRLLPDFSVLITDDNGNAATEQTIGQVNVKGPSVFSGYWQQPNLTHEFVNRDGYFNTGDRGSVGLDGKLRLVGRDGDRIVSGQHDVYPKEVELVLVELDGVHEAAVVGLPHPELGQAVVAFVNADPSLAENDLEIAISHRLAAYKLPRAYFLTTDMPRTAVGKIQKVLLVEEYNNHFFED